MAFCTNCGAELGVGRFCTNCGARIVPTAAGSAPEATVVLPRQPQGPPPSSPPPPPVTPPPAAAPVSTHRGGRSPVSPWWIIVLVVALAGSAGLGIWLAGQGSDDPDGGTTGSPTTAPADPTSPTAPTGSPRDPADLAATATATGPRPIPPGLDLDNNRVTYPAANMLDDDPESAYRLPGDASGAVITFELAETSVLRQVGLINGYTKVDTSGGSTVDWYPRNRRILRVEWAFGDGTTVEQALDPEVRELQLIEVDDVETSTVQLTILEVSAPGAGPGARDVTAISDVLLLGS